MPSGDTRPPVACADAGMIGAAVSLSPPCTPTSAGFVVTQPVNVVAVPVASEQSTVDPSTKNRARQFTCRPTIACPIVAEHYGLSSGPDETD
jgi:hypothetical protein